MVFNLVKSVFLRDHPDQDYAFLFFVLLSHSKDRSFPLTLQHLRLLPERIRLEAPKCFLDPVPSIPITSNLLPSSERARQQTGLASEEDSTSAEQQICRDVACGAGFHGGCEVWKRRLFARSKLQCSRLFSRFEGLEECCAVAANAEGEEGA